MAAIVNLITNLSDELLCSRMCDSIRIQCVLVESSYSLNITRSYSLEDVGINCKNSAYLRGSASKSGNKLADVKRGSVCKLLAIDGDWYKIEYKSKTGFVELSLGAQWGPDLLAFRPYVFVEPYVGYGVTGNESLTTLRPDGTPVAADKINQALQDKAKNKLEYGVGAGLGLEVASHVQLSCQFFRNFGKLYKDTELDNGDLTLIKASYKDLKNYQGIKFSSIIEALLRRIATQGNPREGERNDDLFILVRELRHICDYNFNTLYMLVAPYFPTLPDAEIRRTISNALATNGRTITPVMRGVISELRNVSNASDETDIQLPRLPKLSAVEEMILAHYPKHLRSQVYMAMLPIWGVYGTHIRFNYMDGRENSLSFQTAVVGKSSSGKAFAAHLFDLMTKRIRIEDNIERQKAAEYLAICNKASDASEKPDDPRPRVKLFGDDITTSQMLEYLDNLEGEHAIQFTEEVARLSKAKKTVYGDNDDLLCKAFDNAMGGKESKSHLTRNIRIPIFLNCLYCGTPGGMHKFYNNPEGGLNNRVLFAFMPSVRIKGFPHYENLTETEQAQFDEACDLLSEAGKDGRKVQLPWLEKTVMMLKNKWDKEDDENPDEVWYDLGKRALVVAMRAGVLQWYLRGCPTDEKQIRDIAKVVKWTAEAHRLGVYTFCGKDYEDINDIDNSLMQKQGRMSKNKKLFSVLPDHFSVQELIAMRVQNGDSANVKMVISRWVADGLIRKVSEGCYEKVLQLVA